MSGWGSKLASIWTNNVPPSRPSNSEMCVYTKYLDKLRIHSGRDLDLLVLGSTPEFRDWGYEQNLSIFVADKSEDYYKTITREIRHKNLKETLYITRWEDMSLPHKFDVIIGDLTIGNVQPDLIDRFLKNIYNHLKPNGLFMGKSFLWKTEEIVYTPEQIIKSYYNSPQIHPYTFINHQLGLYCLNKNTCMIDFNDMYVELSKLKQRGVMDEVTFSYFENLGWDSEMKFQFYAPQQKTFIEHVTDSGLNFIRYEDTGDIYMNVFPVYIIQRKER